MTPRTSGHALAGQLGVSMLPVVLSMIAGSVDVIGLYALDMFTSHITGNLVLLAARVVGGATRASASCCRFPSSSSSSC
jgi:uncharacterized membrane protein YoaK (UPF0700 family)